MTKPTSKTEEITTLSRDGRHIIALPQRALTDADGTRCRMAYRDAAHLDFWFKPGQFHDDTLPATTAPRRRRTRAQRTIDSFTSLKETTSDIAETIRS